jgi:hypothetical protein
VLECVFVTVQNVASDLERASEREREKRERQRERVYHERGVLSHPT